MLFQVIIDKEGTQSDKVRSLTSKKGEKGVQKNTFKGGVHPYEGKELSKDRPVEEYFPKGEMVYPLAQHIGAPATPVVKPGDEVKAGQIIAQATGFVSANVCSSVSGTVKKIEPRLVVNGQKSESIVIENDGQYTLAEGVGVKRDYTKMSKEEIRDAVKAAGIVGMGGAGFPAHVKLAPKNEADIDYVIVNGAECEPYLTSDYRMMLEEPEKIVGGLKVILSLFEKAKGVISIEDNKPDAIKVMQDAVKDEDRIEVKALKTKYPQGAERKIIYATTGRKINSSMLPADAGCIVHNIDTVIAIYLAVCESTPIMRRIVTVTGDAIRTPQNFSVKTGTAYAELAEAAGGFVKEPAKIIAGGAMMGMALFDLSVPVTKSSSALLCLSVDEAAKIEPSACIRCGKCVKACPSNLVPQLMMEYAEKHDYDSFVAVNGMECYECGSCTYVCPAKRKLTQAFAEARRSVAAKRRKAKEGK